MAADNSFDIVSKVDIQEVRNAIDQASKEVNARFDLKNSNSSIKLEGDDTIQLASADEYKLKAVIEILQQKVIKRGISLKSLTFGRSSQPLATASAKRSSSSGHRQRKGKEIVASLKTPKRRSRRLSRVRPCASPAKTAILYRRPSLLLKNHDFGIDMQFYELPYQLNSWENWWAHWR